MPAGATAMATSPVSPRALTLRPVAARVVSYGRSTKLAQRATLYVLRVARGGREWYVARRYSEFRALYARLRGVLARPHTGRARLCAQCRELARRVGALAFPSRFRVRSGFASAREKIEGARMQQLDAFVQLLTETTQGLLATQDDDEEEVMDERDRCGDFDHDDDTYDDVDDNYDKDDVQREDRCAALRMIREFLLVHDHLIDDAKKKTNQQPHNHGASPETHECESSTPAPDNAAPTPRGVRPRLTSSGSLGSMTTTFTVQELDVMYRPTSPLSAWIPVGDALASATLAAAASSPNTLDEHELDELFLADYASPAEDDMIHRQVVEGDGVGDAYGGNSAAVQVLRRTESLRVSRRL